MLSDIIQEAFGSLNAARNISRLDLNFTWFQHQVWNWKTFDKIGQNFNLVKVIRNYSPDISQFSWWLFGCALCIKGLSVNFRTFKRQNSWRHSRFHFVCRQHTMDGENDVPRKSNPSHYSFCTATSKYGEWRSWNNSLFEAGVLTFR